MKATKHTITVTIEVLSTDCVGYMISEMADQYRNEFHNGQLVADDGDTVTWTTESKDIEI